MSRSASSRTSTFFWVSLVIPVSAVFATQVDGVASLVTLGIFALILPLLDWIGGMRKPATDSDSTGSPVPFTALLVCFLPLQALGLGLGLLRCRADADWMTIVGFSISCGLAGSVAIIAAHDLLHRPGAATRAVGNSIMALVSYLHFGLFHRIGHHRNAATSEDPSTARLGEGFYSFLLRTVPGCLLVSLKHERERLQRRQVSVLKRSSVLLPYVLVPAVLLVTAWLVGGGRGLVFFALQSVIAIAILECVSYIQHYGLVREKLPNGRYRPMTPLHSWDCNARVSNLFFLNLPLHAEHHASPQREYQNLVHHPESPQLPAGYSTMIGLALFPPLWRRCMDWRVMVARRLPESAACAAPPTAKGESCVDLRAMIT